MNIFTNTIKLFTILIIFTSLCIFAASNNKELKPAKPQKIHITFKNDPSVIGTWESVDFVSKISDFKPNEQNWSTDLFLKQLSFKAEGKMNAPSSNWTKGLIIHHNDNSIAHYEIKTIDNNQYLFMEWMSGDVIIRNMKPKYYVLKKK